MDIILFDDHHRTSLLPFTHTRTAAHIRVGILTIAEKWERHYQATVDYISVPYLNGVYAQNAGAQLSDLYVNARLIPNLELVEIIKNLDMNQALMSDDTILAFRSSMKYQDAEEINADGLSVMEMPEQLTVNLLQNPWDIFHKNESEILSDFEFITRDRVSAPIPDYVTVLGKEHIFIEEGVTLAPAIINASKGKIYLGKNSEVMDGAMLRGTIALCDGATIKMGAKVYEGTTIGPGCKVGGEIQNVVFFGNANKGHDGYLGNAVIGEWCNLGADTNCSNLKNDYGSVKVYSECDKKTLDTGLQFCGLLMGDHSKSAINTAFNTGTVVGVSANIFGAAFPPIFIPSFSWGGAERMITYRLKSGIDTANRMMERRNKKLSDAEEKMMAYIFDITQEQRKN